MNRTDQQQQLSRGESTKFIGEREPNRLIRCLRVIDIFSFLPVPKDDSISTKQSIVGSVIFFVLFLVYVIFDFVNFIYNNPPLEQIYRTPLDSNQYTIPQFSIAFMSNQLNNQTQIYDGLFTYTMQSLTKSQGNETSKNISFVVAEYNTTINNLTWMSQSTKKFYYIQRYPIEETFVKGLLYSTDQNTYIRVKVSYCYNQSYCLDNNTIQQLSNYGRFFLFINNIPDSSSVSRQTLDSNGNNYLLYNFFVIPGFYKRVNINFQVVQTTVLPDYFTSFSNEVTTHLTIQSVYEAVSVVNYQAQNNTDAIAFNMQLSPIKLRNKVSRSTIIDHISMWGALWGVLFGIFALFFLSYNRNKFYRKNPDWDRFKRALQREKLGSDRGQ